MNTSPYDNLPVGKKEMQHEESQQSESLQYIDVPVDDMPEEKPPAAPKPAAPKPAAPKHTHRDSLDIAKVTPLTSSSQYTKLKLKNMQNIQEYILPFEETLLVPDTMADMDAVLFAEGNITPSQPGKSSYEKTDAVSGEIILYTIYKPIGEPDIPVDVIKSSISFKTDKCWENTESNIFKVALSIKSISAEMLNERKFTVKGSVCIRFTEISEKDLMLFAVTGDDDLVQKSSAVNAASLIFEANEVTEISQEINIHDDQPSPVKILKEHFNIVENHRQITSGKLVINGTIISEILYLGEEDEEQKLCCFKNKTDFTQFIPADDSITSDLMQTSFIGDNLKITIESHDLFLLQGKVNTMICGYENKSIPTVSDIYHKKQDIKFDISKQLLAFIEDTVSGEVSSREIVNIDETAKKPKTLLCGSCKIIEITSAAERGRIIIEGNAEVKILALDENEIPFTIDSTVPLRGSLEMAESAENPDLNVSAALKEFWFDSINMRQLEINISISLEIWAIGHENFKMPENLCSVEKKSPPRHISMAIYAVGHGDTLWDIAKRYKTDVETLSQFNRIDAEKPLIEGSKLLIIK